MTNNISYFTLFSAEIFKIKRNAGFIFMLLMPLVFSVLFLSYYVLKNEMFATFGSNPWLDYLSFHFSCYFLFYPLIVAFFTYSYVNIEYENNCFKQLFTLPVSRNRLYFTKVIVVFYVVLFSVLIAYVSFVLSGNSLSVLFPDIGFQDFDTIGVINALFLRTVIILFSISIIQLTLSLLYPNFILSISFALFFTVLSMILTKFEYIPYTFIRKSLNMATNMENQIVFDKTIYVSMIYIVIFIVAGLFVFRRNK